MHRTATSGLLPTLLLLILFAGPGPARAQESSPEETEPAVEPDAPPKQPFRASPYLPLEHPAYSILEYWIAAGRITSLSPFVRPYRRVDVAQALLELVPVELSGGESAWLDRLRAELARELAWLADPGASHVGLSLEAAAGARYYSQTHRDPLRPELDGEFSDGRLLEDLRLELDGQAGVVAGAFRLWRQGIYRHDAQYPDGRVTPPREAFIVDDLSSRVEEGYLELQTRHARVFFGRMYRDWGAPYLDGFLRSAYAYSEEEIGYRVGTIDALVISLSEASVHGGPGQNVDFRIVNPISIWQISGDEEKTAYNKIGVLDAWWHATPGLNVYGSLLADATNREGSCCQMGGSFGIELPRLMSGWVWRANATAIQSLAYRTDLPWEEYSVQRIGIGWDKVDLYLFTLEADGFPLAGLWLGPRLDVQLMGEGDFRQLRPPAEELPDYPRILSGQTETTVRPSISGRWRSGGRFPADLRWDLGVNFISDYDHVPGDSRTEFVATVEGLIRTPRWTF
jgi:hypothetical protein